MSTRPTPSSEERFRALFEQAPFSTQLFAPDGRTLQVNQAWEQLWDVEGKGLLKAHVLSGDYNLLSDPQLEASGVAPLLRRAAMGEAVQLPVMRYDPAALNLPGTPRWVKATARPIQNAAGEVLEIMLIHEDVTQAHEAEAAQRVSELRLRHGLVAARMVIWEWRLDSGKLSFSDNVFSVLGSVPTTIAAFDARIHADDRPRLELARQNACANRVSYHELVRYNRRDDGRPMWLDIRGEVQTDPGGTPACLRGVTLDVTERMTAEAELREADRRKDEFLAMLAHELRNPLAPISTAAQLIKLSGSTEQRLHASEVITRQVAHMTELIDDLLDVSRVTRGLVELHTELLDLREIVHEAVEQAKPLMDARGHTFSLNLPPAPALVNGDRLRLIQVLSNLLNNAAKYTAQEGRIALEITVGPQHVIVTVADNGVGIAPMALARMFDLFTQAERTPDRSQGGLGLGLPLVKSIIELHGGTVVAESEGPGSGSTFVLHLPRVLAPVPETLPQGGVAGGADPLAKTVMVVDDNVDAARSLAALLSARGHRVSLAPDGEVALQMTRDAPAQIYILDIGLPGMDGLELARQLRALASTCNSVLIALTGYGQAHDRILSKSAGFDEHFVKPATIERLEAAFAKAGGALPR